MTRISHIKCPTCGLVTTTNVDVACAGCGTFLKLPPMPEIDPARAAYGDYVRKLKANQQPEGTTAELVRRRSDRAEHRREVHRLRNEGLSIAQTARRLEISTSYVSRLRAEPLD